MFRPLQGVEVPSVLAGQKGRMKVYKLIIQTFCIFDKILSAPAPASHLLNWLNQNF